MRTLEEILQESAALHSHLCPRQVLGARMGLLAGRLLHLELPRGDRRLLVITETDGCLVDAISAATGCRAGRRTLRVEDYGKVAATFVDVETGEAVRVTPHPRCRTAALDYAPQERSPWHAQLAGYPRMPDDLLLAWRWVELRTPVAAIVGRAGSRVLCRTCGEEIINQREVARGDGALCRACASDPYYRVLPHAERPPMEADHARCGGERPPVDRDRLRLGDEHVQPAPAAPAAARPLSARAES